MEEQIRILEAQLLRNVVPNIFISGDVLGNGRVVWTVSIDLDEYPIMVQDKNLESALSRAITSFFIQKSLTKVVLSK